MTDTAAFLGAPVSVLDVAPEPPIPGGVAPAARPAVKAAAAPKAKRGRPAKRAAKRPASPRVTAHDAVNGAADAAATALEKETAAKRGPGRPSVDEKRNAQLEAGLRSFYVGIGGMLTVGGGMFKIARAADVGAAMIVQADDCAKALVAAADQSPALRNALEWLTKAGGASLILAAHGPILMAGLGMGAPTLGATASDGQMAGLDIATLLGAMGGMFDADPAS